MSVMKTNVYVKANLNSLIPFLTKSVKDYLKTGGLYVLLCTQNKAYLGHLFKYGGIYD